MEERCVACGTVVTNAAYTGVFCDGCFEEEQNPSARGWRAWMNTPTAIGAVTAALGLMFHLSVNGVDYVQGAAGLFALLWAVVGAIAAVRNEGDAKKKQLSAAAVVALLGLYEIAGAFFVASY